MACSKLPIAYLIRGAGPSVSGVEPPRGLVQRHVAHFTLADRGPHTMHALSQEILQTPVAADTTYPPHKHTHATSVGYLHPNSVNQPLSKYGAMEAARGHYTYLPHMHRAISVPVYIAAHQACRRDQQSFLIGACLEHAENGIAELPELGLHRHRHKSDVSGGYNRYPRSSGSTPDCACCLAAPQSNRAAYPAPQDVHRKIRSPMLVHVPSHARSKFV